MRAAICCWDLSTYSPSAPRRASPNVNMRWRWIEILPTPMPIIGLGKIFIGRAEETEAHIAEALRLSPRDTMAYNWMTIAGVAKINLGSCEQAVAWCRRAIEANRNYPLAYFLLAAALAQLGRLDEARSAVKAGLALNPAFTISRARAAWTAMSDDPTYLAQARAHSRRHAQGRGPRTMTAPAASPRSSPSTSWATRASWARTRRGRRCLRAARGSPSDSVQRK